VINSRQAIAGGDVASHYDELDYFYRDVWGEHVHHGLWLRGDESRQEAVRALVHLVAKEGQIGKGSRVCDIGCGYGATARLLAEEYGSQVTAMTISPAQHAFAKSLADERGNPTHLLGDWLQNDLPESSFDVAIAIESSEHMPPLAGFFTQAHRVLRPGGRLVVCAWLACEAPSPIQERWLLEPICREGRMPHMGTMSDYERLASLAGFAVERTQDVSRHVAGTWPRIARTFLAKLCARPQYLRFLFNRHARNRVFAFTIFRIWLAYRTGTMRYGVLTAKKMAN
jgi:tocopherol O-methyltransferase